MAKYGGGGVICHDNGNGVAINQSVNNESILYTCGAKRLIISWRHIISAGIGANGGMAININSTASYQLAIAS